MWGSTVPSIYYGFYCHPNLQKAYWTNVFNNHHTLGRSLTDSRQVSVLATLCIIATMHPQFRHPTLRPYRAAMYAGLGLSAIVFVVHGILLHGWTEQNQRMSVDWMGLMALFNLTGAAVYAARVCGQKSNRIGIAHRSTDSGEAAPPEVRYLRKQSSDAACRGDLCRAGAYVWLV